MDVPKVGKCISGVESVLPIDANSYQGTLKIQVGPIRLSFQGTITVEERDREKMKASMRAEAKDAKAGSGVRARMTMTLNPVEAGTNLTVETDLNILGKLGEFGQPIIRKKADAMMREFAENVQRVLKTT
jgi:carbon monoxide dehydrogenase subunit G